MKKGNLMPEAYFAITIGIVLIVLGVLAFRKTEKDSAKEIAEIHAGLTTTETRLDDHFKDFLKVSEIVETKNKYLIDAGTKLTESTNQRFETVEFLIKTLREDVNTLAVRQNSLKRKVYEIPPKKGAGRKALIR